LVCSIAAEGDGHRLPSVVGEMDGGKESGIGERLGEQRPHAPQKRLRVGGGERELMALGTAGGGPPAGAWFFVVGWVLRADRKGLELPPGRYGERGGRDRARIDAPAEKDSHGDVADEAMAYRGTQSFPESLGRRVHPRPRGLERHVPVAVDGNLAGAHRAGGGAPGLPATP